MIWERKQQVGSSRISHWNVCCLLSNWILRGVEIYTSAKKEKFHFRLLSAINGDPMKAFFYFLSLRGLELLLCFLHDGSHDNDNIAVR